MKKLGPKLHLTPCAPALLWEPKVMTNSEVIDRNELSTKRLEARIAKHMIDAIDRYATEGHALSSALRSIVLEREIKRRAVNVRNAIKPLKT